MKRSRPKHRLKRKMFGDGQTSLVMNMILSPARKDGFNSLEVFISSSKLIDVTTTVVCTTKIGDAL